MKDTYTQEEIDEAMAQAELLTALASAFIGGIWDMDGYGGYGGGYGTDNNHKNTTSCYICSGSGKCRECNGTGKSVVYERNPVLGPSFYDDTCRTCYGSGKCNECDGTGRVEAL